MTLAQAAGDIFMQKIAIKNTETANLNNTIRTMLVIVDRGTL